MMNATQVQKLTQELKIFGHQEEESFSRNDTQTRTLVVIAAARISFQS